MTDNTGKSLESVRQEKVRAHVELVFAPKAGSSLLLVGWIFDPESQVREWALYPRVTTEARSLHEGVGGVRLLRMQRADVAKALSSGSDAGADYGFLLYLSEWTSGSSLVLSLDGGGQMPLHIPALISVAEALDWLRTRWESIGFAIAEVSRGWHADTLAVEGLRELVESHLPSNDGNPAVWREESLPSQRSTEHLFPMAASDTAVSDFPGPVTQGGVHANVEITFAPEATHSQVLMGWLFDPGNKVCEWVLYPHAAAEGRSLVEGRGGVRLLRMERADVSAALAPGSRASTRCGFLLYLPEMPEGAVVVLTFDDGGQMPLSVPPLASPARALGWLRTRWEWTGPAVAEVSRGWCADAWLVEGMRDLAEAQSWRDHGQRPTWIEEPGLFHCFIDYAFPLGERGLFVVGWFVCSAGPVHGLHVLTSEGAELDILPSLTRLYRADVLATVESRFVRDNMLGFLCLVPLPVAPDDRVVLRFDLGAVGERRVRVPTHRVSIPGVALAKELLWSIPSADRLRPVLHEVFESGLGDLIESLVAAEPQQKPVVRERQFGEPPVAPCASVVVPLYGRFDFLRHQLAHFADDPEFSDIDLIYVVDDPTIIGAVHDYAAHYHPIFGRPFRLISCGRNLGFAGANNLGVAHARAATLVLLNSDVIPQHAGWVGQLIDALATLPRAGAVAPLLQFGDGGVQHAGMLPRRDPALPGFLMNTHPMKGQPWRGGDSPSWQALLTGACLCLRRADYEACGGFDEGYLVGDFEDSDLCLRLRGLGHDLWLIPGARLWHLERQSQVIDSIEGPRALITLFNAWRYERKIRRGELIDPESRGD
jgi:GT2 family glycosyltransferase